MTVVDPLIADLRATSAIRNVICHASWKAPNPDGSTHVQLISNKREIFQGSNSLETLTQLQLHTVDLIFCVINSVTTIGVQFPGSSGLGKPILKRDQ